MSQRIEDYGLVGDTHTAALIGRDGSMDWLCFPRFDSGACFAALLGDERHGSRELDASLLMIPLVGFLPPSDRRVAGTVEAVESKLLHEGFVRRYSTSTEVDGLPAGEAAFLACTFWLADNLALLSRRRDARRLFERVLALRNDLGLLSEEYDPAARRLVGNFPKPSRTSGSSTPRTT